MDLICVVKNYGEKLATIKEIWDEEKRDQGLNFLWTIDGIDGIDGIDEIDGIDDRREKNQVLTSLVFTL